MRRVFCSMLAVLALSAARADAVTIRDLIELSKAGLSDQVLIALIETDRSVFTLDAATLKQLKDGGVSDAVIVAAIRSGRTPRPEPVPVQPAVQPAPDAEPQPREPQVIVIDHHDQAQAPVAYPVAVPVYVPVVAPSRHILDDGRRLQPGFNGLGNGSVTTIVPTDQGLVKVRVAVPQNCVKAEPVFWGFGGKLRPDSWQPPPTVVCR